MPFTHLFEPDRTATDESERRAAALRVAAGHEMDEIVAATAVQIQQLVLRAHQEMALLQRQVDVSLSGMNRAAATQDCEALPVSQASHEALVSARRQIDRLIASCPAAGSPARSAAVSLESDSAQTVDRAPVKRLGRRSMAMLTVLILTSGVASASAGRWLLGGRRGENRPAVPEAIGTSGDAVRRTTPNAVTSRDASVRSGIVPGSADARGDLGPAGERWLREYFEDGAESVTGSGPVPIIYDERQASDRVVTAAKRAFAPARVAVFGDAAVLSTSVTEYPGGAAANRGDQVVSFVSQLWTRTAGEWHLDEVRIVSARSAESAFGR
jgi:hypothetical protein